MFTEFFCTCGRRTLPTSLHQLPGRVYQTTVPGMKSSTNQVNLFHHCAHDDHRFSTKNHPPFLQTFSFLASEESDEQPSTTRSINRFWTRPPEEPHATSLSPRGCSPFLPSPRKSISSTNKGTCPILCQRYSDSRTYPHRSAGSTIQHARTHARPRSTPTS